MEELRDIHTHFHYGPLVEAGSFYNVLFWMGKSGSTNPEIL